MRKKSDPNVTQHGVGATEEPSSSSDAHSIPQTPTSMLTRSQKYQVYQNISEDMNHWNDTENGGDGFRIEEKPIGSHPLERYVPEEERKGITEPIGCWATSYGWCKKEQLIDLVKEGCEEEDLDNTPLVVNISDWYSPRFDCKVIYKLKVQFFGKNREVIAEYKTQDQQPAGRDWFKMEHSQALPPSTRYILFSHKGKDEQYWAGHYGAKLTLSSVILTFPPKN
ncbi:hypothetical protein FSP39_001896 [Pinctada imbricata]|uniref:FBA domain-containing protein n=1 Tax=Pinctada imbricata TaxID=66713 RepID=A0AA88XUM2_PINIB|nr:hypothetical protein FSP39_001896 [Pinctada imbricata]